MSRAVNRGDRRRPVDAADGAKPDPMATSVLFDVFAVSQAVGRMLAAAMRDGPLTPSEYAIYSAIFELEAATPTEIAARLGMRLTTCMDHLHALEGRGHAARIPHPSDRRSYKVVLTVAGLAAHRVANRTFEVADTRFRRALGADEAAVKDALAGIRAAADAVTEAAGGNAGTAVSRSRSSARGG